MLPVVYCMEGKCIAGIFWYSDFLAEFLAWWMPVNLVSYLLVLLAVAIHPRIRAQPGALTLKRFFLSMFLTLPFGAYGAAVFVYDELFGKAHRRKRQRALDRANQKAYFSNKGV